MTGKKADAGGGGGGKTRYMGRGVWTAPGAPPDYAGGAAHEGPGGPERRIGDRFCPYSLGDWMAAADRAGVPALTADLAAVFETADLMNADWAGPHQKRMQTALNRIATVTAARPGWMFRWDVGAGPHIKEHFGLPRDRVLEPGKRRLLMLDDPRLHDMLPDWPRPSMPVWTRPWIEDELMGIGGWPVEYRVFVENTEVIGVSSYYIQRPLPEPGPGIDDVRAAAERLVADGCPDGMCDWGDAVMTQFSAAAMLGGGRGLFGGTGGRTAPKRKMDKLHATIDFLLLKDGTPVLLEGGPPVWAGADPCCFRYRKIEGTALEAQERGEND